jgi:hypothetical protein
MNERSKISIRQRTDMEFGSVEKAVKHLLLFFAQPYSRLNHGQTITQGSCT